MQALVSVFIALSLSRPDITVEEEKYVLAVEALGTTRRGRAYGLTVRAGV